MDVNSFEPTVANMEVNNWRTQMPTVHRERIIHRIIENLRRRIPALGQLEPSDIQKVAKRFEERIFLHAKSQGDYVQKISSKLISLYRLTPNLGVNSSPSDCTRVAENSVDQASCCLQPQHHEQGISISNFLTSQSQASQQLSPQNFLKNTTSSGSHSNANARLKLTTATSSSQTSPITFDQNSMLQSTLQNPVDSQQLQQVVPQHNEQQPQISHQNPCNQEVQHNQLQQTRMEEQRIEHTHMVSSAEKQTSFTQASSPMNAIETAPSLNLTHNQQCSVHQSVSEENPLSVLRIQQQQHQDPTTHQKRASVPQRTLAQQKQQLVRQQPICNNIEQDHQNRQQNGVTDTHQLQQVLVWNHHSSTQARQLGQQRFYPRLRGVQSRISGSANEEQNAYMLQQDEVAVQHQPEQIMATLLPTKGNKSEPQLPEQQINSQIQLQQQQPNILQQDILLRHQTSDSFQQHHAIKQEKQLSQSAISFPAESSNLTSETAQKNEDGCGEEIYEKIKAMSNMFQPELKKIFQKISIRYQQVGSISCKALRLSVDDMESVVNMVDRTAGTEPGNGSRAAVGEDLMATTCHSRIGNSTEPILVPERRNLLCYTSPVPSNTISSTEIINDSLKQLTDSEIYGLESTATSCSKRRKIEVCRGDLGFRVKKTTFDLISLFDFRI